jgi:hypothetical protein
MKTLEIAENRVRRVQSHNFTNIHWGQEFVIEFPYEQAKGSLIGQGSLRSDDRIILCIQCRVEEVDYYGNEPDLWQARIALEKPISLETIVSCKMSRFLKSLLKHRAIWHSR